MLNSPFSYGRRVVLLTLLQFARQISQRLDMPQLQGIINRFCMSFAQKVGVIAWCSEPSAVEVKADYLRGRFADVYRAEHNGRSVAIKALRWYENIPKSDIVKNFIREVVIMVLLGDHPNVIQVIGLSTYRGVSCLILPWMVNGTLPEFLHSRSHEPKSCCRMKLILDIINGMLHLKRSGIIHGDLKGCNILVDDGGNAVIADFGLSCFEEYHSNWMSHLGIADSQDTDESSRAGTLRWMAPELFLPENFGRLYVRPTYQTDIFALGMVIYEIYSGLIPYHEDNNWMALSHIIRGNRPRRPINIPDKVWCLVQQCWAHDPLLRPSIESVHAQLKGE